MILRLYRVSHQLNPPRHLLTLLTGLSLKYAQMLYYCILISCNLLTHIKGVPNHPAGLSSVEMRQRRIQNFVLTKTPYFNQKELRKLFSTLKNTQGSFLGTCIRKKGGRVYHFQVNDPYNLGKKYLKLL